MIQRHSSTSSSKRRDKRIISRIICVLSVIILVLCGVHYMQKMTSTAYFKYKSFFDNPEEYDVLFFGTSHVSWGVSPLQIYKETGIKSFNFGSGTCTVPCTYWKLKSVLEYTTPKLVVIDCYRLTIDYKAPSVYRIHGAFDFLPLSTTKVNMCYDLMYNEKYSVKDRIEILFPFYTYHSRWNDINNTPYYNMDLKGEGYVDEPIAVRTPQEISYTDAETQITDQMVGIEYLEKIVDLCRDNNIEVLFTYFPFPAGETERMEANLVYDVAQKYNVDYINLLDIPCIDYYTDMRDSNSHLNILGRKKLSSYLGQYIMDKYVDNESLGNTEQVDRWNNDYYVYHEYHCELLKEQDDLKAYLMLLAAVGLDYDIKVPVNLADGDNVYRRLLENFDYYEMNDSSEVSITTYKDGEIFDERVYEVGRNITSKGSSVVSELLK